MGSASTGFGFDAEAVYQDADIEQAEYEAQARGIAAQKRRGICGHGWMRGPGTAGWPDHAEIDADRARGDFPERETNYEQPAAGMVLCLDCGQHIADPLARR
jgi:hypothetical protein